MGHLQQASAEAAHTEPAVTVWFHLDAVPPIRIFFKKAVIFGEDIDQGDTFFRAISDGAWS
jgi:hypothetical protein